MDSPVDLGVCGPNISVRDVIHSIIYSCLVYSAEDKCRTSDTF